MLRVDSFGGKASVERGRASLREGGRHFLPLFAVLDMLVHAVCIFAEIVTLKIVQTDFREGDLRVRAALALALGQAAVLRLTRAVHHCERRSRQQRAALLS